MKPKFLVVFIKEFRETLRDKRALGLLALFVVMYPAMVGLGLGKLIDRTTTPEREGIEVIVIGGQQAPTLMSLLKQKNVNVTESGPMTDEAITNVLRDKKVVAVLRLGDKFGDTYAAMRPARIDLWFDSASDSGRKTRDVEEVLRNYGNSIAGARLLAHGVSPATLAPVQVQRYDTGTNASRSATFIGAMLGSFFIPAFIFCLSSAVDSTAGERERRSLEVLLAQPARPVDLIVGKWLAAGALSVIGITLELGMAHGVLKWLPLEEIGMSWRLSSVDLVFVCIATIPLSLFAAAFEIALAMNAKSFKEAQSTVSFAVMLPMVPMVVVPMLELKTATWMYLVPVLSNQTLLRELAKGQEIGAMPFILTFGSSLLIALACIGWASWRMKSERYVLTV
ncbi:ABC transporter permease [Massilia glaciei]|uniref:ABC transporter permease n=1 Tax=Massilia glaciei TaxID=1524097 RepID=A0A2U2HP13_9BURK|nr:ABC transporter permease [Massilia glaciei]PWF49251.1 ABC transporter permease [Massilia glaciei]